MTGTTFEALGLLCVVSTRAEMSTVLAFLTRRAPELGWLGQRVGQVWLSLSLFGLPQNMVVSGNKPHPPYMALACPERAVCQNPPILSKAGQELAGRHFCWCDRQTQIQGGWSMDSTSWQENVGKNLVTMFWRQHCHLVLW